MTLTGIVRLGRFWPGLALLTVLGLSVPTVRADNIDARLNEEAPAIMKYLQQHNVKNVGVLLFRLQKGKSPSSFNAGPINANMATRLENLLILYAENDKSLGVIRNASAVVASQLPKSHWNEANDAMRAATFKFDYPLAWGNQKVKANAFLVGSVGLSEDLKKTTVLIAGYRPGTPSIEKIVQFSVDTDRNILADSGQSFLLSRSLIKKRSTEVRKRGESLDQMLDKDAVMDADMRDKKQPTDASGSEYIDFQVIYDNNVQPMQPDEMSPGELRIPKPQPGQEIRFELINKSPEELGVVIMVNGKSTIDESVETPDQCRKWILPADGAKYTVRGFYNEENQRDVVSPFRVVMRDDPLVVNELANSKLGVIEVFLFLRGKVGPEPPVEDEMLISQRKLSLRGVSGTSMKKTGTPRSLADAQSQLMRAAGMKKNVQERKATTGGGITKRDFIVKDPDETRKIMLDLERREKIQNPTLVGAPVIIRYNSIQTSGGQQ